MTLTDFLLARIAEDEAVFDGGCVCGYALPEGDPRCDLRMLAECQAKRRIVEVYTHDYGWSTEHDGELAKMTLELLAVPYADHPNYRNEWKP